MSPVLANIVLNRLDWYLSSKRMAFVRYADDLCIFCRSESEAEMAKRDLERFLNEELCLELNQEKTRIIRAEDLVFLGYAFARDGKQYVLSMNEKLANKMLEKVIYAMRRKYVKTDEVMEWVGSFNRGWLNYYKKIRFDLNVPLLWEVEKRELDELHDIIKNRCTDEMPMKIILENKGFTLISEWIEELKERSVEP